MLDRWIARQLALPTGWIGRWVTAPWLNRANREMNRLVLDGLDLSPGMRVLEVGFGGGGLLAAVLAAGASAAGADLSADMVARAARRLRSAVAAGRLELRQADATALPWGPASFDRVCTVNTIYFWSDPAAAVAELRRMLAPGGRLVVGFDDRRALEAWPGHRHGFRLYEVAEVEALLREAGLEPLPAASAAGGGFHRVAARAERPTSG